MLLSGLLLAACLAGGAGDVPAAAKLESDDRSGRWPSSGRQAKGSAEGRGSPGAPPQPGAPPGLATRSDAASTPRAAAGGGAAEVTESEIERVGGFDDAAFVSLAASGGRLVVTSSTWMSNQPGPRPVVAFAARLAADHERVLAELELVAAASGIAVSDRLLPPHHALVVEIEGVPAARRVEAFLVLQERAHREAAELYARCAIVCDDRDLRAFASRVLPVLRAHHARSMQVTLTPE